MPRTSGVWRIRSPSQDITTSSNVGRLISSSFRLVRTRYD
jgi:hypothetical protein